MKKTTRTKASTVSGLALSLLLGGASFAGGPSQAVAHQGGAHAWPRVFVRVPGAAPGWVAPLPSPPAGGPSDRVYADGKNGGGGNLAAPPPEPEDKWPLWWPPGRLQLAGGNKGVPTPPGVTQPPGGRLDAPEPEPAPEEELALSHPPSLLQLANSGSGGGGGITTPRPGDEDEGDCA